MKRYTLFLVLPLLLALGCSPRAPEEQARAGDPTPTSPPVTATLAPTFTPMPSATPTLAATATAEPTATPPPTATAEPTATLPPVASQSQLVGLAHDYQRLNNCGPTTAAMTLSYYGLSLTQYDIAPVLKGGESDKNVAPEELSAFIQAQGFEAPIRVNGDLDTVRALIANGIPVIVEQWLERPDDALTGHYRVVIGYDQAAGLFTVNDSYTGPGRQYSEQDFDRWWRAFGRLYIPVYRPDQASLVRAIVGADQWEEAAMWRAALTLAEAEIAAGADLYGWFNLGTARLRLGDVPGAVAAFDQAIALGLPERMLWYQFAPLEALHAAGDYDRVLALTQPLVGMKIEEIHFWRGAALEGLGRPQEALAEYRASMSFNASYAPAAQAAQRLGG